MRNAALERLTPLVGRWDLTLTNAWFLDSLGTEVNGEASFEWLDGSLLVFRWGVGDTPPAVSVIGHSDAQDSYYVLYHDDRGVARLFRMALDEGRWTMAREDSDFHQRFTAEIADDRITAAWEASEDEGATWRKDFDLTFTRRELAQM